MTRYRFRLEQVLRVRQVQADLAAAELGAAQRAEADAIRAEQTRRLAATERSRPSGAYRPDELHAQRLVWDAELATLDRAEAGRIAAARLTVERRDEWLSASRRVKALELLDERRREEHRVASDRAEALRIDDLVAARHVGAAQPGVGR